MNLDNPFKIIYDQLLILTDKVDNLENKSNPKPLEEDLTDASGASKLLNYKKGTIYNLVHKNVIPHHKKEGKLYFFKSELIEYIKTGKVKTQIEISQEVNERLSALKEGANKGRNQLNTPCKEQSKNNDYSLSDKIKVTCISAAEQNENIEDATEETANLHYTQNESEIKEESNE
jgi:excisionase family DNA binding protein